MRAMAVKAWRFSAGIAGLLLVGATATVTGIFIGYAVAWIVREAGL